MTRAADLMPHIKQGKRGRGRPSPIYDHNVVTTVLTAIEDGCTMEAAAGLAGITPRILFLWRARGEAETERREDPDDTPARRKENGEPSWEHEEVYFHYLRAVTLAQSTVEKEYVAAIRQAVAGGFVTRQVTRTLRDGTVEEEVTYQAPDGKLALQFLMRTRPGTWDRQGPSRTEITGAGGGPIEVNDSGIVGLAAKIDAAMRAQRALPDVDGEVVDALE